MASSNHGDHQTATVSATPIISAIHNDCRHKGAISSRRPAPLSCATDGGMAINTPTHNNNATVQIELPTVTAASVRRPWRPASRESTTLISMAASCPSANGRASTKLTRISRSRRARRLVEWVMG